MSFDKPAYKKIDLDSWPRKEHFRYYQEQIQCSLSVTARIDVTSMLSYAHQMKRHFFGCLLYAVSYTINSMDCMKMMLDDDGNPGVWKTSNPVFTTFHPEDKTFSDLWMDYTPDFDAFYQEYLSVKETFGSNKGIKGRAGQPENFFCFSCAPWLDFVSCSNSSKNPSLFPIIDCGRYTEKDGRYTMPVSLTISHSSADGFHMSEFFRNLQKNVDSF